MCAWCLCLCEVGRALCVRLSTRLCAPVRFVRCPQSVLQLPPSSQVFAASSPVFLRLSLIHSSTGAVETTNTYWLSAQPDVLDWNASTFYRTPCSAYTDYSGLCHLPAASVTGAITGTVPSPTEPGYSIVTVKVTNTGPGVAFFVRLRLQVTGAPTDVLPVLWSDNYVTLFGHEGVVVTATAPTPSVTGPLTLIVEVFNNVVTCA